VSVLNSARLANIAAGIKVGKFGAAAIQREEVRRSIVAAHAAFDYQSKIVAPADIRSISASLRRAGRRIVFTNGCFDILHAGHVTYLNWCKAQGDVLVLGLNSDASVRRLGKGPDRPVNSQDDRSRVVAALADIDFVCVFGEDTPEKLIRAVKPDVLVKGGDWQGKDIPGGAFVREHGGEVRFAPFLPGRSTTGTLERIRKAECQ
jgi:D-beta-D-heptose 7-phosphate kinase/D-beta-D-heptose 1-phosphate adenosyltransferase